MKRSYYILSIVFVGIAFGLLFLPQYKVKQGINPEILLQQLNDPTRIIGIDEVAERMITKDPTLLLVDVRLSWDFEDFSLPGAIHIPLTEIVFAANEGNLTHPHKDIVFYSNGDITANQARAIALQHGVTNSYVLEGGLNNWFTSIIMATPPTETATEVEYEQYMFRRSVAVYFGMAIPNKAKGSATTKKELVPLVKANDKKESIEEEGC
ncbi:MAG: rhodanese-like domain-containing protein [Bacteroidales bacterium]|jgi:rhodanese-related sulfurtransferase|nr:rhodanese-like domain-containing protein [Bacteroidales bacterium]